MLSAIVILLAFILTVFVICKLLKFGMKVFGIIILSVLLTCTTAICIKKPQMHKPFSLNIIEYFIKINDDGSMTTTKQVTKTIIKEKKQEEK